MAKIYTAQEMRMAANDLASSQVRMNKRDIARMLRQAADALEREEKRETKYEYAERLPDGTVINLRRGTLEEMKAVCLFPDSSIVRHKVGEWEEVKQ